MRQETKNAPVGAFLRSQLSIVESSVKCTALLLAFCVYLFPEPYYSKYADE